MKKQEKTLQQALEIISRDRHGKRDVLSEEVGSDNYKTLCVLGFITDGTTFDPETSERIRVWEITNRPNLFAKIKREPSEKEIQFLNKYLEFSY